MAHGGQWKAVFLSSVLPRGFLFVQKSSIHGSSAGDFDQEFLLCFSDFLPLMVLFCAVTLVPSLLSSPQQLAGNVY